MYTLSDIYMLETSHYIQSLSDQYIIESYVCESFRDVVSNLVDKIKKMFNKVKEFFKRLFGKNTNNDKKLEDIEKVVNNNSKLKNKKIKTTDTNKFDKIVDNANKQGKKITAKQIIAAAGITTATIGAIILGIKKFKKNTPNELEKQEKEAIKKAEDIKKEEDKVVNNNNNTTNTEPKTVEGNNKNRQKMIELQNELEKINAQIRRNNNAVESAYREATKAYDDYILADKRCFAYNEKNGIPGMIDCYHDGHKVKEDSDLYKEKDTEKRLLNRIKSITNGSLMRYEVVKKVFNNNRDLKKNYHDATHFASDLSMDGSLDRYFNSLEIVYNYNTDKCILKETHTSKKIKKEMCSTRAVKFELINYANDYIESFVHDMVKRRGDKISKLTKKDYDKKAKYDELADKYNDMYFTRRAANGILSNKAKDLKNKIKELS